ncbi:bifunctional hydroxymethylpyrimidine kinase/phosphomethylpyrimidine kinase [Gracilibacillus dipsosauri]|uniref:pyridoxal kinase n=1 Tax=Gracilibacillus dipsosauri TaxID=178340 RepID=A0A317KWY9_9BACI|nr:bifunctional hydroxymethylpyrimidine kinase/phosphomethylpyrimidine kinase [Gracilibacillus dipsosauri]PWU68021.1 bifunctional hydroxymethylpyrimidine kinase/phosphomethylpyrimidine kinase [Gracilibacillus dipsosauri]
MERVLTIAGAAAQGSAGIQADLKTFQERNVYGMSAITATVTNQSRTEKKIFLRTIEEIEAQLYTAVEKVGIDAIKTGMLFSTTIIERVVTFIARNKSPYLVVDPVMIGKMGSQLLADDAIEVLKKQLIPLATIITPNRLEAARLLNKKIPETVEELKAYAVQLHELGGSYVFVKGGKMEGKAVDVLYDGESCHIYETEFVDTIHTSGAGCSFAACLTAELAKGVEIRDAIEISKSYVYYAIKHSLSFGKGVGSVQPAAYRLFHNSSQ